MSDTAPRPPLKSAPKTENLRTIEDKDMGSGSRTLAAYLVAAALSVALGVAVPALPLSWIGAVAYLLVALWVVPAVVRRVR